MEFIIKSKYWKVEPIGDANITAQVIANRTGPGVMIGIPKAKGNELLLNYLHKQSKQEMQAYNSISYKLIPTTKTEFLNNHEQYDWFVSHSGLTTTGMNVTILSPF